MIGGFVPMSQGKVLVDGRDISTLPPYRRELGVVFQDYALFPHMTVEENVMFPLKMRSIERTRARLLVQNMLAVVQLSGYGKRLPSQLSGGERQRVALARALVFEPSVLLMDEPLGALDRKLRDEMQRELRRLHEEMSVTILTVTHDQEEALMLSDRIAIMNRGRLEQLGTPQDIYDSPQSVFVADFMGESNFIYGTAQSKAGSARLFRSTSGEACLAAKEVGQIHPGDQSILMVRPERVRLLGDGEQGDINVFRGLVDDVVFLGEKVRYRVTIAGSWSIVASLTAAAYESPMQRGESVAIGWAAEDCCLFQASDQLLTTEQPIQEEESMDTAPS
jgi:putative spermidine/putrescine transport system ATP-binding protein